MELILPLPPDLEDLGDLSFLSFPFFLRSKRNDSSAVSAEAETAKIIDDTQISADNFMLSSLSLLLFELMIQQRCNDKSESHGESLQL